jgi:serine carboxypeptidase-like clade 2
LIKGDYAACGTYTTVNVSCKAFAAEITKESQIDESTLFNPYSVYGDCPTFKLSTNERRSKMSTKEFLFNPHLRDSHVPPCLDGLGIYTLLRNQTFLKKINVNSNVTWGVCNSLNFTKDPRASIYLYPKLIQNNIRIWKFSGDVHDNLY